MAVLWTQREQDDSWRPTELNGDPAPLAGVSSAAGAVATVLPLVGSADRILITGRRASISINGNPLLLGIRVLRDRDAIRVGPSPCVYFSLETLPVVVPCPEARPVPCARCKTDIAPGFPAVRCPSCGAWHHQGGDLLCWSHVERCAACQRLTLMDGQYHRTPEGL